MKDRKCWMTGLLCLLLMITASCSSVTDSERSPDKTQGEEDRVSIRFLHIWREHDETMQKMIDAIEEKNDDLRVDVNSVDWSGLNREISAAIASDDMYDVFFQYATHIDSMQKEGLLLNLDEYLTNEWQNDFLLGALDEYRIGGTLYGIPFRGSGVLVIYNKDLFARKGWREPTSQEELSALMQLMLNEDLIPMAAAGRPNGFQLDALRRIVTNYLTETAGNLDNPERLNGRRVDWQGELAVGAQTVKSWANKGFFGADPLSVNQTAAMNQFLSGRAAMLLCNTNELYQLRNQKSYMPFEMGCFLFPSLKDGGDRLFSESCFQDGFAVWANTQHPEQAIELLKGLTDQVQCAEWAGETLSVMSVADVQYEDELLIKFNEYFRVAGRHRVVPDYALGDSDDLKAQLFVDYMTSEMTADEFESNYETIIRNAIAASERR